MKTLQMRIAEIYKLPVEIRIHENSSTYLRAENKFGVLWLHMHRFFSEAPTPVLEAVVRFAKKKDKQALKVIRRMAELYFEENPAEPTSLIAKGHAYDLEAIYEQVKAQYFPPDYHASIGWSDKSRSGKRRSITFGTYDRQRRQIRMNRCLDSQKVPLYFVEFVVYHEMLHGIYLPKTGFLGRTRIHTAEFRAKEKEFIHFAQAKVWEKANVKLCMTMGDFYGRT